MRRYLIDENISKTYRRQLQYYNPSLKVLAIGDEGAPTRGTSDPEILKWCEKNNFTLVTNARKTMPRHLAAHLAGGHKVPGVFIINLNMPMGELLDELIRIAVTYPDDQFLDQLVFIPIQ